MKKLLSLVLVALMVLSLAACSSKTAETPAPTTQQTEPKTETKTEAQPQEAKAEPAPAAEDINWPTKPITLLCGYSAGGSSDLQCRYLAEELSNILGVPVVVENKPGAASWLAFEELAAAAPDGYTFGLINNGLITGQYSKETPRDKNENDYTFLASHVSDPTGLWMKANETRFTDWESFVAWGKETTPIMAAAGTGYLANVPVFNSFLETTYGFALDLVPVNSSNDGKLMFVAGDTDIQFSALSDALTELEKGEWKMLCLFSDVAPEKFPDAPLAINVTGTNLNLNTTRGYAFPKGVDQKIVDKMIDALVKAINSDTVKGQMAAMNTDTYCITGEEFKNKMVSDVQLRIDIEAAADKLRNAN